MEYLDYSLPNASLGFNHCEWNVGQTVIRTDCFWSATTFA